MSLFGTYDWWFAQCTKKEHKKENIEFHAESLYLVDLVKDGPQVILVGSLSGTLWAFNPSSINLSQDLLFEYYFQEPILAMQSGYLVIGSNEKHLAVLHPTRLKVYSFSMNAGNVAHGQQFYLDPVYAITFEFLAYNFVIGPFGPMVSKSNNIIENERSTGPKSTNTSICVQSLDGHLHFYANDLNFLCPPSKTHFRKSASFKKDMPSDDLKLPYNLKQKENADFPREKKMENVFNITKADVHSFPSNNIPTVNEKISDKENTSISSDGMNLRCSVELDEGNVQLFQNQSKVDDFNECAIHISKPKFIVAPFEDNFLPTLLCYIPADDCFIIFSGSWLLNCYSYRNLELQQAGPRMKKTTVPEWTYILGEPIFYLTFLHYIFAVGTRGNLVAINRCGVPHYFIDLNFCPSAFHPYISDDKIMFLAVSEEEILFVYDGGPIQSDPNDPQLYPHTPPMLTCITRLIWSTKLPTIPVALSVGHFEELVGLIIILSEQGYIHCCYLGTSPRNFIEIPRENTKFNEELKEVPPTTLNHPTVESNTCKSNTCKTNTSKSDNGSNKNLEMILKTVKSLSSNECVKGAIDLEDEMEEKFMETNCCTREIYFSLILCPATPLNNVCIAVSVDQPFLVSIEKNFIARLSEKMTTSLQVTAHFCGLSTEYEIPNLRIEVIISGYGSCCITKEKLPLHVYHTCFLMPISVICSVDNSLHFETSDPEMKFELALQGQEVPSLTSLFPEFQTNQVLNGSKTSTLHILLYDNHHKRIQVAMKCDSCSGNFQVDKSVYSISSKCSLALKFMLIVLAQKMKKYQSSLEGHIVECGKQQKENIFHENFLASLTFKELIEAIEKHFEERLHIIKLNDSLGICRKQLHLAECSIISKVKDVTPKPSIFSEIVVEKLFKKIMNKIDSLKLAQKALENRKRELVILWQVIQKLLPELSENSIYKSLLEITCCDLPENALQQGWEERTEAGLFYLFKITKKSSRENLSLITTELVECNTLQLCNLKDEISELLQKYI